MLKFITMWMVIGAATRYVRGRGRWWRFMVLGPLYVPIWIIVKRDEAEAAARRRAISRNGE